MDLPINNGDFHSYVKLPEGTNNVFLFFLFHSVGLQEPLCQQLEILRWDFNRNIIYEVVFFQTKFIIILPSEIALAGNPHPLTCIPSGSLL